MGALDEVVDGALLGWAYDPAQPDGRARVDICIDDSSLQTIEASLFREDLVSLRKGGGYHGFKAVLSAERLDGQEHTIDVRIAGSDQFLMNGRIRHVLRRPPQVSVRELLASGARVSGPKWNGLSVIIPTYNRSALLEESLRACLGSITTDVEFIVVDDGSSDNTPALLQQLCREFPCLRTAATPHRGPGLARNIGAQTASFDLLMFIGDDIRPQYPSLFQNHIEMHRLFPSENVGVLGKIVWPNRPADDVNFVMAHVQGVGQQQFGFNYLTPYDWLDWRFFYTSNVSLKRSAVPDWSKAGFSPEFYVANFEDAELAYRLNEEKPDGFRLIYAPAAAAVHYHPYSVKTFLQRQLSAGLMADVFLRLHPAAVRDLGVDRLVTALSEPAGTASPFVAEGTSVIEGLKSWAVLVDTQYRLGSQNWHGDLLDAVFELAYYQGFVISRGGNYGAAYRWMLDRFQERMTRALSIEALGHTAQFKAV
jgi:glycosyltransferase involved in cell wall biosynthesis